MVYMARFMYNPGLISRDEDPTFVSLYPDPAQLKKKYGSGTDSGSDLTSKSSFQA